MPLALLKVVLEEEDLVDVLHQLELGELEVQLIR